MLAARAVECLLFIFDGQKAKNERFCGHQAQLHDAIGDGRVDIFIVARLAFNDAAEANHGIRVVMAIEDARAERQFVAAWHLAHKDFFGRCAVLDERFVASIEEGSRDMRVPFRNDDAEAHVRGMWDDIWVVFRQIFERGSHVVGMIFG